MNAPHKPTRGVKVLVISKMESAIRNFRIAREE